MSEMPRNGFRSSAALSRPAKFQFIVQAIAARLAAIAKRQSPAHERVASDRLDPAAIMLPDSSAALSASAHAQALCKPWLFQHCLRTYAWAALLAQTDRIRFDRELLFVACALHDLGLSEMRDGHASDCACFAVEGAREARRFCAERIGWDNERCDRLAEAIALHLNVSVGLKHGPEAHLLNAGAAFDVVGLRWREIAENARRTVLSVHPRLDFKTGMIAQMKSQARNRPDSRAALLVKLGFCNMIRDAPFEDDRACPG